ncbi:MAG TPA: hypothetical protein VN516_08420, partial [Candidatus Baltobacteraceae bacterium]|nr:hypothetical protein [Candidatus Baltobacteraceae bacterium]
FSLYLVGNFNQSRGVVATTNAAALDFARIKTTHPDLANAPVYPVMLAGLMKILPFHFTVDLKKSFWSGGGKFAIYQPDFFIALFNQIFLLAAAALTFFIARKLFDVPVARLSATLVIGCNLLWRFSISGISTMLLLVIFLSLVWCILKIDERARELQPNHNGILRLAVIMGILTGVGALTRYAFGWTIIPVAAFLFFFGGQRRALHVLATLGAFAMILMPWIIRNYSISGTPFGTAGFAIAEGTYLFPRFQLERSIHPDLTYIALLTPYLHKLGDNSIGIINDQLPRLGGSWASAFFLAGLFLGFRSIAIRRMRYFLLMCLGIFIVVQALGQTQLAAESPEINSENLLVLLAPLVFIYGVSLFFTLLDQMELPAFQLRYVIIAGFIILSCLPMRVLLWSKTSPIAYPPYYPPEIQQTAGWLGKDDMMMSDIPWAVAWYGDRQCVWLSLNAQNDFYAINDEVKPIHGLYLTPETMDAKFLSDWILPREFSWGTFILQAVTQGQTPPNFPLRFSPPQVKFLPERLFLADREYWKIQSNPTQ